jgi:hypothetical protein
MQEKKPHVLSLIIAALCILTYAAALALAGYRFYNTIHDRGIQAESEFFSLSDLASSYGVSGFMNESFKNSIQASLASSSALEAVIISGPAGEYAFERNRGKDISYVGDSPRFAHSFGVSSTPFYTPLHIDGLRNVTISAVYRYLDPARCIAILRDTLILVLAALVLSFLTFIVDTAINADRIKEKIQKEKEKQKKPEKTPQKAVVEAPGVDAALDASLDASPEALTPEASLPEAPPVPQFPDLPSLDFPEAPGETTGEAAEAASGTSDNDGFPDFDFPEPPAAEEPEAVPAAEEPETVEAEPEVEPSAEQEPEPEPPVPDELTNTIESELADAEETGQDMAVMVMNYKDAGAETQAQLKDAADDYFSSPAQVYEHDQGLSVMLPGDDLNSAVNKVKDFCTILPAGLDGDKLRMGLSSRADRLRSDGEGLSRRLVMEAEEALKRTSDDNPIMALQVDREKYREVVGSAVTPR